MSKSLVTDRRLLICMIILFLILVANCTYLVHKLSEVGLKTLVEEVWEGSGK